MIPRISWCPWYDRTPFAILLLVRRVRWAILALLKAARPLRRNVCGQGVVRSLVPPRDEVLEKSPRLAVQTLSLSRRERAVSTCGSSNCGLDTYSLTEVGWISRIVSPLDTDKILTPDLVERLDLSDNVRERLRSFRVLVQVNGKVE